MAANKSVCYTYHGKTLIYSLHTEQRGWPIITHLFKSFIVIERSFLCLPRLHLYQKYNKNSNTVKYYNSLKEPFIIWIYFKNLIYSWDTKLNFSIITPVFIDYYQCWKLWSMYLQFWSIYKYTIISICPSEKSVNFFKKISLTQNLFK